eukprot:gene7437-1331_t
MPSPRLQAEVQAGGARPQSPDGTRAPQLPPEMLLCSVCLDRLVRPVTLVCGHSFCEHCIIQALAKAPWAECPMCRTAVDTVPCINKFLEEVLTSMYGQEVNAREQEVRESCPNLSHQSGFKRFLQSHFPPSAYAGNLFYLLLFIVVFSWAWIGLRWWFGPVPPLDRWSVHHHKEGKTMFDDVLFTDQDLAAARDTATSHPRLTALLLWCLVLMLSPKRSLLPGPLPPDALLVRPPQQMFYHLITWYTSPSMSGFFLSFGNGFGVSSTGMPADATL